MSEEEKARKPVPITYGDVFDVMGELASRPITPKDATVLQLAENMVIGMPQKEGPAGIMRSAARENVKHGFVHDEDVTDLVQNEGVTLLEFEAGGGHYVTEAVAGQVVGKCSGPVTGTDDSPITIGEALEAASLTAGEKAVKKSDAAAIEAAEIKAMGKDKAIPGGLAEEAYSAASRNLKVERDEDKITLRDVLEDAKKKFPNEKAVSREVAEAVIVAELTHNPDVQTDPGGISASVAGAARLNEQK